MCEYIAAGAADPLVQSIAARAWKTLGGGSEDPAAKCWAAFWWAKHNVKFRSDEATMFRIGERDQQDLLIAPAVLVRMKEPAEDCDGFTMLVAALLCCLGVDVAIATVAVDPRDASRFSHVFCCAMFDGQVLPLDASHGASPGWMVPAEHISRWQAWDLQGSPIDVSPIKNRGLHGYVRRGVGMYQRLGMGDACTDFNIGCDPSTLGAGPSYSPSGGSGTDWSAFIQSLATSGVKLATNIFTPPAYQQTTRDAAGNLTSTTVRNATGNTALTATGGGLATSPSLVYLGLGAIALVVLVAGMKKN